MKKPQLDELRSVRFTYGCFADGLEKQANKQGFTLGDKAEFLEKLNKAFLLCKIHLCTDGQADAMNKKLHKKVVDALSEVEGLIE